MRTRLLGGMSWEGFYSYNSARFSTLMFRFSQELFRTGMINYVLRIYGQCEDNTDDSSYELQINKKLIKRFNMPLPPQFDTLAL